MNVTREDRLRQLEEKVQLCRAAVLHDAPGTVGDPALQGVVPGMTLGARLCERLRALCAKLAHYCRVGQLWANDDSRDVRLEKLGNALLEVHDLSGGAATLEEAIAAYEESLQLRPLGHSRHATALDNLGGALRQFCKDVKKDSTDTARLDRCILLHREALQLRPPGHSTRDASLNNLANSLRIRFEQRGDSKTLDEAIELHREALQLRPPGQPYRDAWLNDLATTLSTLFEQQGGLETLDEAIVLHREALQLRPPGHPHHESSLNSLAYMLQLRCDIREDLKLETIDETIKLYREALQLRPLGHPNRDASLNALALSLTLRFDQQGGLETLDEAIRLGREELQLHPPGHPGRPLSLVSLSNRLSMRHQQQGDLKALDESIILLRKVLKLFLPGYPHRCVPVNNLALALHARFEQQGSLEMLDEAITLHREALQLCPSGHPLRALSLNNFATTLSTLFEQQGGLDTLDEAIILHREALQLLPHGHTLRGSSLNRLAVTLKTRFERQLEGGLEALNEAITLHRKALQLRPPGHLARGETMTDLAITLLIHSEQQGSLEALDEAITLNREALQLRPPGHPNRFQSLFAFARCFLISGSERFDFTTATAHVSEALVDNAAHVRGRLFHTRYDLPAIDSAYATIVKDADLTTRAEHGSVVLQLYYQAIQLLPRAANFGLDSSTRLQAIAGSDQLSRDAAVHAIGLGRLKEAVEILEEGRGVFWSQALHLRAAGLNGVPENERCELKRIFDVLQADSSMIEDPSEPAEDRERKLAARRMLNVEAEDLICKTRTYPGLERFLLPPAFDSLMASLPSGFVVILNSSRLGCHALLLNGATGLAKSLAVAVTAGGFDLKMARTRLPRDIGSETMVVEGDDGIRAMKVVDGKVATFEDTLQSMWVSLVRPVMIGLGLEKAVGSTRPRLWWCATGDFGFLPVHAAGDYTSSSNRECTSDYVVSSYVPTLTALAKARQDWHAIPRSDVKSLVICEESSGPRHLPNVRYELEIVRAALEAAQTQVLNSLSTHTSCAQMRSLLAESNAHVLHLASHGVQDSDPLKSAFLMQDGGFSIQDIMDLNLPNAVLAFLSACETAKGDKQAPDQAVHLAASMLFCGFRSVIGSMWLMSDEDGPKVASGMYERLSAKDKLDLDDIPYALDDAVRTLRDSGVPADRWALYMHMGG